MWRGTEIEPGAPVNRFVLINSREEYDAKHWNGDLIQRFPPVGATGTVLYGPDYDGEYEVVFDDYPLPFPNDPTWFVHKSMVVFIDEKREPEALKSSVGTEE